MTPDPKRLLNKAEAKERLGMKTDKELAGLIRRGKLRVIKYSLTAPLRFRQMDIDACLESCAVTGEPDQPADSPRSVGQPAAPAPAEMRKEQAP